MTPLDRLLRKAQVAAVDGDGALAFAKEPAPGLLLLPGDPARPEVTDVAVVVTALTANFPELRVAIARVEEATMRASFNVSAFPALLFVKGGEIRTTLARMQSWSAYEGAARALEGAS